MYRYTESGLDNVFLKNGYEIKESPYGELVSIHNMDGLHKAIAESIVQYSPTPMNGKEFRFLRIELDLSQRVLADILGRKEQTVSLWERGERKVPKDCDLLLRAMYQEKVNGSAQIKALFDQLSKIDREVARLELEEKESGDWGIAA